MKHIELFVEEYFSEPASRRFGAMEGHETLRDLFTYLQDGEQVLRMIDHSELKRPAMECLIEEVERMFHGKEDYDILRVMRHRQITGSMIRFIMGHYGYWPGPAKKMKKGHYIKTAIVYNKRKEIR